MKAKDAPKSLEERKAVYLRIMVEIKDRLSVIQRLVGADDNWLIGREGCYLQFRHISELIAMACLAAHGNIDVYAATDGEYAPGKVFKSLEKSNSHYFPQPVTFTDGDVHQITRVFDSNAIGSKGLVELWAQSGNYLHSHSVKRFLYTDVVNKQSKNDVHKIALSIGALLSNHWITIKDSSTGLLVSLNDPEGLAIASYMTISGNQVDISTTRLTRVQKA